MPSWAKKTLIPAAAPASRHRALAASLSLTEIILRARVRCRAVSVPVGPASRTSAVRMSSFTELAISYPTTAGSVTATVVPATASNTATLTCPGRPARYNRTSPSSPTEPGAGTVGPGSAGAELVGVGVGGCAVTGTDLTDLASATGMIRGAAPARRMAGATASVGATPAVPTTSPDGDPAVAADVRVGTVAIAAPIRSVPAVPPDPPSALGRGVRPPHSPAATKAIPALHRSVDRCHTESV
ncbi:hypothetical protein [Candidatus Frankia nodulisporulans]|uniref:hypothetical protein n=1 Tax=Candidatus Frankia nodulisporulans TaxID=2060052 RepID=UPI001CDD0754|nr:hypothetical protein [Candidatus Frankia nodulisporulans]